jgi:CTP:molybdopterin cytidylyltransferase MocA
VVRYRDADLSLPAALTVELDLTPTAPAEALSLAEASLARLLPGLDLCAVRRPPGLPLRQGKQSIRHVADAADSRTSLPAGQAARTRTGKTPPGGEGPAAGLILAAGYSRRMGGRAKALAQLGGKSLLERSVSALRQGGVSLIVAVIGHDGVKTGREATRLGIRAVTNPDIDEGMFSSVRAGLVHLAPEQCGAVLVLPVDAALVLGRSVSAMLALGQEKLAAASPLVPSFLGRPGHPVLIPASHRPALRRWSGQGGLRGYLAGLALALQRDLQPPLHCPLPDAGIVCDLDTPAQLAEAEAFLAATGDRSHPSLDEAWQELTLAGPAQGGIRHALLVAGGAARLARGLKARGLSPPRESGPAFSRLVPLCLRAGLLHAVTGRRADPAAKDGARLASLGWEETAGLVGRFQSEIALSECPEPDIRLALAAACVRMAAALALEDNPGAWEGFVPDGRRTGADMGLEAWFASALGRPPRDCIRDTPPDEEERRLALLAAGADADQEKL